MPGGGGGGGGSPEPSRLSEEDEDVFSLSTSPSNSNSDSALSLTNMDLLHGALSSLSLTDKCALSLTIQQQSQAAGLAPEHRALGSALGVGVGVGAARADERHTPEDFEVCGAAAVDLYVDRLPEYSC
jgi:hypothetical protein